MRGEIGKAAEVVGDAIEVNRLGHAGNDIPAGLTREAASGGRGGKRERGRTRRFRRLPASRVEER